MALTLRLSEKEVQLVEDLKHRIGENTTSKLLKHLLKKHLPMMDKVESLQKDLHQKSERILMLEELIRRMDYNLREARELNVEIKKVLYSNNNFPF